MAASAWPSSRRRVPFVHATVVRAQVPTSAQAGDDAIVLRDGSIEGFVGGQCAEGSVRRRRSDALATGETLLLRVLPDGGERTSPSRRGAQVVVNPCLSGGALEIFLEPMLPRAAGRVVGGTPIADAVVDARPGRSGFVGRRVAPGQVPPAPTAVVVASHGRDEAERSGPRWTPASATSRWSPAARAARGAGLDRARPDGGTGRGCAPRPGWTSAPAPPPEIALSILAEVVQARTAATAVLAAPVGEPAGVRGRPSTRSAA